MRRRISIRGRPSVGPSVRPSRVIFEGDKSDVIGHHRRCWTNPALLFIADVVGHLYRDVARLRWSSPASSVISGVVGYFSQHSSYMTPSSGRTFVSPVVTKVPGFLGGWMFVRI